MKYVRSNLVIFRHPLPPFTLLNNRMTSFKQQMYAFVLAPSLPLRAYVLYGWSLIALLSYSEVIKKALLPLTVF